MKIQILDSRIEQPVEGYDKHIDFANLSSGLSELSDNQCTYVLAPEILNGFALPQYQELLTALVSKLRMNGELVVGGTELRAFTDAVRNKKLDMQTSNQIISRCQSMADVHETCQLINSLGRFHVTWSCSGVHYEIKVRRV
jgi:hypothetical protein